MTNYLKKENPKCKFCYDKGYSTIATGGNTAMGDFEGDPSVKIPLEIEKIPCKRCQPEEQAIVESSIRFGKTTKAFMNFLAEGRKGKSIIYSTPEGDFLSPKAAQSLLEAARIVERERASNIIGKLIEYDDCAEYEDCSTQGYNKRIKEAQQKILSPNQDNV